MNETTTKTKATESKVPAGAETEILAMPVPFRPLAVSRMRVIRSSETDFGNVHGVVTPAGTPVEFLTRPEYWQLHANRLRIADTIEAHTDDGVYFARLLVRSVDGTGAAKTRATVALLEVHRFDVLEPDFTATTHKVEMKGPHLRWCVVRIADNKIISDGHDSADVAEAALRNVVRTPVKSRDAAA
jgi:hypothetical protein